MDKLKDYCVTFVPQDEMSVDKKLMLISQAFMKLPEESAEKLKKLFQKGKEFSISEFKI